jgi:hypothetical protein
MSVFQYRETNYDITFINERKFYILIVLRTGSSCKKSECYKKCLLEWFLQFFIEMVLKSRWSYIIFKVFCVLKNSKFIFHFYLCSVVTWRIYDFKCSKFDPCSHSSALKYLVPYGPEFAVCLLHETLRREWQFYLNGSTK